MEIQRPEQYSPSIRSQENIDFVGAHVIEKPNMSISRRSEQIVEPQNSEFYE